MDLCAIFVRLIVRDVIMELLVENVGKDLR